jgi:hypothetical protein
MDLRECAGDKGGLKELLRVSPGDKASARNPRSAVILRGGLKSCDVRSMPLSAGRARGEGGRILTLTGEVARARGGVAALAGEDPETGEVARLIGKDPKMGESRARGGVEGLIGDIGRPLEAVILR